MEFENYVDVYGEILARVHDKEVATAILSEVAKDRREAEFGKNMSGAERATPNQLSYLGRLGVEVKDGLSKAEASKLIDEAKLTR